MHPAAVDTTTGLAANAADMAAGTVGATKTTTKADMQKKAGIGEYANSSMPVFSISPHTSRLLAL